jgi:hypothetical protein
MATQYNPYIQRVPGDMVTAEDWNGVQLKVQEDIAAQVKKAIGEITNVPNAGDAAKLGGKTPEEWQKETIAKALAEIPGRTGYQMLFKRLKADDDYKVINHGLKACPLVDIYQLDYFKAVCPKGHGEKCKAWVNFYLYHSDEGTISVKTNNAAEEIEIESTTSQPFKINFVDMLERYRVEYDNKKSLEDLETEFWRALFRDPNDKFEAKQYCHSPWYEKCCGEKRTVGELKEEGSWNEMWVKMVPRKTINYLTPVAGGVPAAILATAVQPAPTQVEVVHFDFERVGLKLLAKPVYPSEVLAEIKNKQELKVMVLLKV